MTRFARKMVLIWLVSLVTPLWAACNSSILLTKPDSIYTDNNDGTVTDKQTGLMWQKCAMGQTYATNSCSGSATNYDWKSALEAAQTANGLVSYGHNDWRLPSIRELMTLTETACSSPTINSNLFPTVAGQFWSSSVYAGANTGTAWVVNFSDASEGNEFENSTTVQARLVRGGQ